MFRHGHQRISVAIQCRLHGGDPPPGLRGLNNVSMSCDDAGCRRSYPCMTGVETLTCCSQSVSSGEPLSRSSRRGEVSIMSGSTVGSHGQTASSSRVSRLYRESHETICTLVCHVAPGCSSSTVSLLWSVVNNSTSCSVPAIIPVIVRPDS